MQYKDGDLFIGRFWHGAMQTGVLYAGGRGTPRVVATMRSEKWTPALDQRVIDAFRPAEVFEGPLSVTILSADGLENSDWLDKTDGKVEGLFRSATGGMQQFSTQVVENKLNPVWNKSFLLSKVGPEDTLTLSVKDSDAWATDDDLGQVTLVFSSKLPTKLHLQVTGHGQERLNVLAAVASDPQVEAVVGEPCSQYVIATPKRITMQSEAMTGGMRWSHSRAYHNMDPQSFLMWGSVVNGLEAGDGWVKICDGSSGGKMAYLPKTSQVGEPVLMPFSAAGAIDAATFLAPIAGKIVGPEKPKAASSTTSTTPVLPEAALTTAPAPTPVFPPPPATLPPIVLPGAPTTAAPATTTAAPAPQPASSTVPMNSDVWASQWDDWTAWSNDHQMPPSPPVAVVTFAPPVAPPVAPATVAPAKFELSADDFEFQKDFKASMELQKGSKLQVDDSVTVLVGFDTLRSCDSTLTIGGCTMVGVTIARGAKGTVVAPGPDGSVIMRFSGVGAPQLVLGEQIPAVGLISPDNVCNNGQVRVSDVINGNLLPGLVGSVMDLSASGDSMTINFPSMNGTQLVKANDFDKLACSETKYECSGKEMVVVHDLKLESGVELLAGQWVVLKQLARDVLQVEFGSPPKAASIPSRSFAYLACLASESYEETQAAPLVSEDDLLLSSVSWMSGYQRRLSGAEQRSRRLASVSALKKLFTTPKPPKVLPSWCPGIAATTPAPPSVAPAGSTLPAIDPASQDTCRPPELATYAQGDLEIVYSALLQGMNYSSSDNKSTDALKTALAQAIANITGASAIITEFREESNRTVVMGTIRPKNDLSSRQDLCAMLLSQSKSILQTALALANPSATAQAPEVVAAHTAVQTVDLSRKSALTTSDGRSVLSFDLILTGQEAAKVSDSAGLDAARTAAEKALTLAIGSDISGTTVRVTPSYPRGATMKLQLSFHVPGAAQAKTIAWRLRAVGSAYLQALLRPILGTSTAVASLSQGELEVPLGTVELSMLSGPGLSTTEMLLVEILGARVIVPFNGSSATALTVPTVTGLVPGSHLAMHATTQLGQYPLLRFPPPPMCSAGLGPPPITGDVAVPLPALPPPATYPINLDELLRRLLEKGKCCPEAERLGLCRPGNQSYTDVPVDIFNLTETLLCSVQDETWEPLDMPGAGPSQEVTIAACQARCSLTYGCAHYSYWLEGGICHLQNAFAYRTGNRIGFISGPPGCLPGQTSSEIEEIYLMKKVCFDVDVSRVPLDMVGSPPESARDVLACQERCQQTYGCYYFTYNSLTGICHVTDQDAQAVPNMVYYTSGPASCQSPMLQTFVVPNLDFGCLQHNELLAWSFESAIRSAIAAVTLGNITETNVAVVPKPYQPSSLTPSANRGTFVEVLVFPPNFVPYETVNASLKETNELSNVLCYAINLVPHICTCKKGFALTVQDLTVPQLVGDDWRNPETFADQARAARMAAVMNPGEAAATLALRERIRVAAKPSMADIVSRSQTAGELQVKHGRSIVDRVRVSGTTAGTLLVFASMAILAAGVLSVSAGTACSRAARRWCRARRLEQVAEPWESRPIVRGSWREDISDYEGGSPINADGSAQGFVPMPMPRIDSGFRPSQPTGDDDTDRMRPPIGFQPLASHDGGRSAQRFGGLSSLLGLQQREAPAGAAREVLSMSERQVAAFARAPAPRDHSDDLMASD